MSFGHVSYFELSWDILSEILVPYVSFISAPCCLAAAAGLVAPLRPCTDDLVTPFLGFRHGKNPQTRPSASKLLQPRVNLIHVAPPTAISCCCIGGSELERAALEVSELVTLLKL
jgi:hypothetical protein